MKSKLLILAAVVMTVVSCKKDTEKTTYQPEAPAKKNFSVEVDVTAEKKDDFALYYTEDKTINFAAGQVLWHGVKGGNTSEKVVYDLPEEAVPTNIRLDFGLKKGADQGDVTVSHVKYINYGKTFEFKGSDFFKYFIPNDSIKTQVDAAAGTIKILKNPKSKTTPFFYPTGAIEAEIAKLTK